MQEARNALPGEEFPESLAGALQEYLAAGPQVVVVHLAHQAGQSAPTEEAGALRTGSAEVRPGT